MTDEPSREPEASPGDQAVARRKLAAATPQDTKGRSGCLAWGAVLGVLFGIMFALYGLGPILRHYYGEDEVAAGEEWADGDRRLRLTSVAVGPDTDPGTAEDVVSATVSKAGFEPGEPAPGRFRLEVEGIEDWILPLAQLPGAHPSGDVIELRFPLPDGLDALAVRPVAVHLEDPLVRFAVGDVQRSP